MYTWAVYVVSGSCIDQFMNTIVDIFGKVCDQKLCFVCGDFNIDLLKLNEHKLMTEQKPSRITKEHATLIDNSFTNVHDQVTSGLLLSDKR